MFSGIQVFVNFSIQSSKLYDFVHHAKGISVKFILIYVTMPLMLSIPQNLTVEFLRLLPNNILILLLV